jgi:hypothetical protein
MKTNPAVESMRWVYAVLALFAGWIGLVVYMVLQLSSTGARRIGGFLLVLGVLNLLIYRKSGPALRSTTKPSANFLARFRGRIGETKIQIFFLGIGIIFTVGGCVLVMMGSA